MTSLRPFVLGWDAPVRGRRRRAGALRAVTVALAVTAAAASPATVLAAPPAGPVAAPVDAGAPAVHFDDGSAPANPVDPSLVPGGSGAGHAKVLAGLRPDGSSGFLPFHRRAYAYGAYRFQLVASGPDGDVEQLRAPTEAVAAELTAVTNLTFSVDPGVVARPAGVGRFPGGWCAPGSGHQCSMFDDGDRSVGVIRIGFAASSPCGALSPRGSGGGTLGCGGPESGSRPGGDVHHVRGNVWVSPSVADVNAPVADVVIAHETAHALGLDHYDQAFTAVAGRTPVRQLMYPSVHGDPSDTGGRYRSGDVNGLRWLVPPDAWFIGATYRDFLGRIPDTDGFHFWREADVTPAAYVDALAGSGEWVGRIVGEFYTDVFGRPPDPGGFAYWSGVVRARGVPFVAAQLYGSDEYLRVQGGTVEGVVAGLYRQLLGRDAAADPAGFAYWVADAGRRGRVAVAHDLFQSLEKRSDRVRALYCTLLDRPPDAGGQAFWADVILTQGDLALARFLATSHEYADRADDFALLPLDTPPPC